MIDYSKEIVASLSNVLPTYYEMTLQKGTKVPCISYQERSNVQQESGDTLGYSRLSYTIKVWSKSAKEIQEYALEVDAVMRELRFKRVSCNELYDNQSPMIQQIMTYEALAKEEY